MAPPTHLDGSLLVTVQSWCFGGSKLMAWLIFGYVSSPTMHEMPSSPAKANARGTTCLLLIIVGYVRFQQTPRPGLGLEVCVCVWWSITSAASDRRSAPASLQPPWLRLSLSLFPLPASPRDRCTIPMLTIYIESIQKIKKREETARQIGQCDSGRSKTSRTATSGARRSIEGKECLRREVHHGTHLDGEPEPGALASECLRA